MYRADKDGLPEERINAQMLCYTYNQTPPNQYEKHVQLLDALLGSHGKNVWIEAPFRCDYGSNIHVGENFYANYDCIFLDVAPITIGSGVMLAPRVGIYTAGIPCIPKRAIPAGNLAARCALGTTAGLAQTSSFVRV